MPKIFLRSICLGICALLLSVQVQAQVQAAAAVEKFKIVINIPSRTLILYEGGKVVREYPVGVGTSDHQTPTGKFVVVAKEINPTWIKPVHSDESPVVIPSGPNNPLGYRWMEFSELYGIHGTNNPGSIGGYVSNGCIRMQESDVEELYAMVPLKTIVEILYERAVVRKDAEQAITLSVYPDEYHLQPLNVASVYQKLAPHGVGSFIEREQIDRALNNPAGDTIHIGRTFSLMVFGKKLLERGLVQANDNYLPVFPIAGEAKMTVVWDTAAKVMTSAYGSAPGYVKNDILYIKQRDLQAVFALYASWYPTPDTMYLSTGQVG